MSSLTQKQSGLLSYIYTYRFHHGHTPALKEIVSALDISDNKSALRMINSLVEKGYLTKETKKTNTLNLSDKGYQLVSSVPTKYEKSPEIDTKGLSTQYGQSGISEYLPISNTLSHQQQKVDTSGTGDKLDLHTIIETAINLAISKYFNGTQLSSLDSPIVKKIDPVTIFGKIFSGKKLSANTQWSVTIIFLTWAFNFITGDVSVSFCYSVLGSLFIKYLIKE